MHDVLWELSWANVVMLSASIPKIGDDKKDPRGEEIKSAKELMELVQ